jgi:hypothetical protein
MNRGPARSYIGPNILKKKTKNPWGLQDSPYWHKEVKSYIQEKFSTYNFETEKCDRQ